MDETIKIERFWALIRFLCILLRCINVTEN